MSLKNLSLGKFYLDVNNEVSKVRFLFDMIRKR